MESYPVIVVGGGAAGLVAAIAAGRVLREEGQGWVLLLEKMDRVGKKLLATGNGRCNLTNLWAIHQDYFGDPDLIGTVLDSHPPDRVLDFFASLGLLWREEEEGRVYPLSGTASSVVDVLRLELTRLPIVCLCSQTVTGVKQQGKGFLLSTADETFFGSRIIITTGGKASPTLGSDGSGLDMLSKLGFRTIPLAPSLVQLKSDSPYPKQVKGIRFTGNGKLKQGEKILAQERGEFLFTENGVSGIAALQLSRHYAKCDRNRQNDFFLLLDFLPEYAFEGVLQLLRQQVERLGDNPCAELFLGMFHRKIGETLLKEAGVSPADCKEKLLNSALQKRLCALIKGFPLRITGTRGFQSAQVTSGGLRGEDFFPHTLESKGHKGLYAAGEILDVDGPCGGYNLQWAWSSGLLAGKSAALSLETIGGLA